METFTRPLQCIHIVINSITIILPGMQHEILQWIVNLGQGHSSLL